MQLINAIRSLIFQENGQGMTEYGLIIVLVAMALIVSLVTFKDKLLVLFNKMILAITLA